MNESVVFFYFQFVLVNWVYKSRVALLEQIYVLRYQVFVVLNSHKSSLFLCGFYFNMPSGSDWAVAIPTSGSCGRLITKSVYTGVSD